MPSAAEIARVFELCPPGTSEKRVSELFHLDSIQMQRALSELWEDDRGHTQDDWATVKTKKTRRTEQREAETSNRGRGRGRGGVLRSSRGRGSSAPVGYGGRGGRGGNGRETTTTSRGRGKGRGESKRNVKTGRGTSEEPSIKEASSVDVQKQTVHSVVPPGSAWATKLTVPANIIPVQHSTSSLESTSWGHSSTPVKTKKQVTVDEEMITLQPILSSTSDNAWTRGSPLRSTHASPMAAPPASPLTVNALPSQVEQMMSSGTLHAVLSNDSLLSTSAHTSTSLDLLGAPLSPGRTGSPKSTLKLGKWDSTSQVSELPLQFGSFSLEGSPDSRGTRNSTSGWKTSSWSDESTVPQNARSYDVSNTASTQLDNSTYGTASNTTASIPSQLHASKAMGSGYGFGLPLPGASAHPQTMAMPSYGQPTNGSTSASKTSVPSSTPSSTGVDNSSQRNMNMQANGGYESSGQHAQNSSNGQHPMYSQQQQYGAPPPPPGMAMNNYNPYNYGNYYQQQQGQYGYYQNPQQYAAAYNAPRQQYPPPRGNAPNYGGDNNFSQMGYSEHQYPAPGFGELGGYANHAPRGNDNARKPNTSSKTGTESVNPSSTKSTHAGPPGYESARGQEGTGSMPYGQAQPYGWEGGYSQQQNSGWNMAPQHGMPYQGQQHPMPYGSGRGAAPGAHTAAPSSSGPSSKWSS